LFVSFSAFAGGHEGAGGFYASYDMPMGGHAGSGGFYASYDDMFMGSHEGAGGFENKVQIETFSKLIKLIESNEITNEELQEFIENNSTEL